MTRLYAASLTVAVLVGVNTGLASNTLAWAAPAVTDGIRADGGATPSPTSPRPTYTPRPAGGYQTGESIGIRLLEAPVSRRDDPRAQTSVVDHLQPGTTIHRRIEVSNSSRKRTDRRIEVYPGAATIKDDTFVVSSGKKPNELASWISVNYPILDMPPDTNAVVQVTIRVPTTATEGERYAAIWARTTTDPKRSRNIGLASGVAIPVFLDVGPGGEPPSDFQIAGLTPGRTKDGTPQIRARVRNTGHRALVMSGTLTLTANTDTGRLSAGPFTARLGTTLRPGDSAPVVITLDELVTAGPWTAKLTLRSGRVEHIATATLTFPTKLGTWGLPASMNSPLPVALTATAALTAVAVAILIFVAIRRSRGRPKWHGAA
jgi:hypothetical protein